MRYRTGWISSSADGKVEHYPYCNKIAQTAAKPEEHGASNGKTILVCA